MYIVYNIVENVIIWSYLLVNLANLIKPYLLDNICFIRDFMLTYNVYIIYLVYINIYIYICLLCI